MPMNLRTTIDQFTDWHHGDDERAARVEAAITNHEALIIAVEHFYACERLDHIDRIAADFDDECDQQYEDLMAACEAAKGEPVGAGQ